jgi:hypothetical protein
MTLNVENLVRSGVVLAVGLPLTLTVGSLVNTTADLARNSTPSASEVVQQELKDTLTVPCLKYLVTETDSKLERTAKNEIDEIIGGEVSHGAVCKWVL